MTDVAITEDVMADARVSAAAMVTRVHTEPPNRVWSHIRNLPRIHLEAVCVVLAAACPAEQSLDDLLAWIEESDDDEPPLDETVRHNAMLTVCRHAADAEDAAGLLAMLGLVGGETASPREYRTAMPNPGTCRECGAPTVSRDAGPLGRGEKWYGGNGLCTTHNQAAYRKKLRRAVS